MNYGNALKTHILEPVISLKKDGRTEYRIQSDTLFTSSLRLVNHGVDNGFGTYNALMGYLENVDAIYLYDNETLLDGIQNIKPYVGFKHFNNANDFNGCMGQTLTGSKLGFKLAGRADYDTEQQTIQPGDYFTSSNTGVDVKSGWLNLRSLLPMLEASMFIPTNVFKKLRLVIEYKNLSSQTDNKRPLLCIDEVVNSDKKDAIMRDYQGVRFNAIINDARVIPAGGSSLTPGQTEDQETNFLLKGFDNKVLSRCVVVKTPTSNEKQGAYVNSGSKQMLRESFQVRVNGKNLYAGEGLQGEPQILDQLTQHYGTCNSISTQLKMNADASGNASVSNQNLVGELSYLGFKVDDKVNELQFRYKRTLEHDSDNTGNQNTSVYNQQLNLQFYGECDKQITRQGQDYLVSFA